MDGLPGRYTLGMIILCAVVWVSIAIGVGVRFEPLIEYIRHVGVTNFAKSIALFPLVMVMFGIGLDMGDYIVNNDPNTNT